MCCKIKCIIASCIVFPSFTWFILQRGYTAVGVNCVCVFWHLAPGMFRVRRLQISTRKFGQQLPNYWFHSKMSLKPISFCNQFLMFVLITNNSKVTHMNITQLIFSECVLSNLQTQNQPAGTSLSLQLA